MSGNYVVPGANPNVFTGVETVSAGTNISLTGTATNPIINNDTKMIATNTRLATSIGSSLTDIATLSTTVTGTSDLFISASLGLLSVNLPQNQTALVNAAVYISLNGGGFTLVGGTYQVSVSGSHGNPPTSSSETLTFTVNRQPQAPGNVTLMLRASSSITSPNMGLILVNLTCISQLQ
jgi:hypothetical protein